LQQFKNHNYCEEWTVSPEHTELYNFWLRCKKQKNNVLNVNSSNKEIITQSDNKCKSGELTLTENCDMDIDIVMVEDGNSHIITEDNIFNNDSSSNSIVVIPIADENLANVVKNDTCNDDWILINKCMEDPDGQLISTLIK